MYKVFALLGMTWFVAGSTFAVILAGGDGTQNTTAPVGGQGWDYVGRIDKPGVYSSVTYVSNNWFVTANHIKQLDNPSGVILGGSSYTIDSGSWTRLQNSASGDADLIMFRVNESIGLPGLTIRSSATANGSGLTMIGNGRNRETTETYWNSSWDEVTPPPPATYSGYKWAAGSSKRWGTNNKDADAGLIDDGYGVTDMFYVDFDDIGGNEAQGATYDSGGGVFYDNGGEYELAGVMLVTSGYAGQPGSTAVYGNRTYAADMQYYADQINTTTAIPEPSVLALTVGFPAVTFFIRRIFRV
ncbi:MAG TPA: hypothetical protein VIR63_02065 [Pontiella sp.]